MKLATELKIGYLYEVKDYNESFLWLFTVFLKGRYRGRLITSWKHAEIAGRSDTWHFSDSNISLVPETDEKFDDIADFAFYEIGLANDVPEYFL